MATITGVTVSNIDPTDIEVRKSTTSDKVVLHVGETFLYFDDVIAFDNVLAEIARQRLQLREAPRA